jgi:hydroxypyruvate reductase
MYLGLPEAVRASTPTIIITKDGHANGAPDLPHVEIREASHPMPCARSIAAGEAALAFVQDCAPDSRLLMLVSGGASALVEVLPSGMSLENLMERTKIALSNGSTIGQINAERIAHSRIKGGKLLAAFSGWRADVLAISDVQGDGIDVIGSGIGAYGEGTLRYSCHIVGSNAVARDATAARATALGIKVHHNAETLYGDINEVAGDILATVDGATGLDGIYIFGGEPTVQLPDNPGEGGRNQGLALELAYRIAGRSALSILVAGTDGSDGVSAGAGAIVDGQSFGAADGAEDAIRLANSGAFFRVTGDQLVTGPTGTNVMDLVIVHCRTRDPG